jgi:hypothetical protein
MKTRDQYAMLPPRWDAPQVAPMKPNNGALTMRKQYMTINEIAKADASDVEGRKNMRQIYAEASRATSASVEELLAALSA